MPRKPNNSGTTPVLWPIDSLRPHPRQSALFHDLTDEELAELARDIEKNGQRVPVEVKPDGTIISGHQRVRALQLLGRTEVWVIIRADLDGDEVAVERRLIEDNLHRRQLDPLGRARCFQRLLELERGRRPGSLDQRHRGELRDQVAARFGLSGRNVARYLAVLKLPMSVQEAFSAGKLTLVEAARLGGLSRQSREQIGEAISQGQDLRDVLQQHSASRCGRRSGGDGSDAVAAQVSALRQWLGRARQLPEETGPLSDGDRQTLTEAQAIIGQMLGRVSSSPGARRRGNRKATGVSPDMVSDIKNHKY